jgi:hypothetical protein
MTDSGNEHHAEASHHIYLWGARALIVALFVVMGLLIRKAWNKKRAGTAEGAEAKTA